MSKKNARVHETQNDDGSTTLSMKLSEMSLEQLEQVNQALGRQRDSIREQMLHVRGLIDKKVDGKRAEDINAEIARLVAERDGTAAHVGGQVDGIAQGAMMDLQASETVEHKG